MDADCERVVALEQRLLDHGVRANPATLLSLLHPDFVEFGVSGRVWTREDVAAGIASDVGQIEAVGMAAERLSPDVVLLTYRTRTSRGGALRSSIWTRDGVGSWLLRFHQGTTVRT